MTPVQGFGFWNGSNQFLMGTYPFILVLHSTCRRGLCPFRQLAWSPRCPCWKLGRGGPFDYRGEKEREREAALQIS